MKIMQICFAPIVNSAGGAEKVFCNMSNHFIKTKEVIDVCCDDLVGRPFYDLDEKVKFVNLGEDCDLKIPFSVKVQNEIARLFRKLGNDIEWPKEVFRRKQINGRLKSLLRQEKPDVVVCYELRSMVAIAESGFPLSKIVVMFHMDIDSIVKSLSAKQEQILHNVRFIQVLLESYKQALINLGYNNVVCIGNIVPQYEDGDCYGKEKTIIHVGRLDKNHKRQHLLIEAFSKIAPQYPDWSVKFFGGDSKPKTYEKELQNLIQKNKLENQVFLMGKTSDIDVELKKASIFAFPSAYEGFPLALTEGMSMGLPAIGFMNCPAVNELIKDSSNGVLCEESVDALANALEELMQDEGKRISYGKQAKEDMQRYLADKIYAEWDCLIEEMLQVDN
ncbi:MAG: glycosyltransferase [Acidaminococcaceae bacterium]|nr:glycosyltransferase [Acidaminococcaceae bacterium]